MKSIKFTITITVLIILFFYVDNTLSFYGRGFNFFNNKIVFGYTTDFDSLDGFKIEEEGFIQIIGRGTKVSKNVEVSNVVEYSYDSLGIVCKILDNRNQVFYVKVQYNQKGKPGTNIYYTLIQKSEINNHLKWYKVNNSAFIQTLEIFKIFIVMFLITFLTIIYSFRKKHS